MGFQITTKLRNFLLLEDIWDYHPGHDPYVFLARSLRRRVNLSQVQGTVEESLHIKTFMIPIEQKNHVLGEVSYEDVFNEGQPYFEDSGRYVTGESFEHNGIQFEIIVNSRLFEGIGLAYYEPTDRLVLYLNLHRSGNNWNNPYSTDTIIKTNGTTRGWDPHDNYISVRKSELTDYLAARNCGLLILRYSERILETPNQLDDLPQPFNDVPTKSGRRSWIIDKAPSDRNKYMYFCRLWESFWIDPASHPRRWDAQSPEEFKDGVNFVIGDGETTTYKKDGKDRYFELLSFKPTLFSSFISFPNNSIGFHCLSDLELRYADGASLTGCVNSEGQFQTFFGSVAKLDIEKQRHLAGFSEPRKAKPSYEYLRTHIEAKWPETLPFCWTLSNCLRSVNIVWQAKCGETLFLGPTENQIPISIQIGPTSMDYDELADNMMDLQKAVISEAKIENIKKELDYSTFATDQSSYTNMRSIGFTRLLFRANRSDQQDGESYVLKVINDLRNCKGHPKDIQQTLDKYEVPTTSPRMAYLHIMAEFCNFILVFKEITEKLFDTGIDVEAGKVDDPWNQLEIAQKYFRQPF